MPYLFKNFNNQELYWEIQEVICQIDDQHPQEPKIKRLFALTYDLGKRLDLVREQ